LNSQPQFAIMIHNKVKQSLKLHLKETFRQLPWHSLNCYVVHS